MIGGSAWTSGGVVLLAALLSTPASADEQWAGGVHLFGESGELRTATPFSLPAEVRPFATRDGTAELYLRRQANGVVWEWAGDYAVAEKSKPSAQGRLNEAYVDFAAGEIDLTVGKKVISSGIGFGFRPLDVIQREDRRALFAPRLEGVPLISAERIDGDSALGLIYLNRLDANEHGVTRGAHEAVVRYYRLSGDLESHALIHLHQRFGPAPGAGFTWVKGAGFELHGAALYQPRFERAVHEGTVLASGDPWQRREARDDGKALLGLTWTGEAGYSLLLEAWHDGEAMTANQWKHLRNLAATQRALLGMAPAATVYGNLAFDLRAFERPVLRQQNLLARLSYDGETNDPYFDLLLTPEDGGYVATLGIETELRQGLKLTAGARRIDGPADSAYGMLPVRAIVFAELHAEVVR